MEKKVFWYEALKAGTIIGMVSVAFTILGRLVGEAEMTTWVKILNGVRFGLILTLIYGFTRKVSRMHSAEAGFSYARGIGFIMATMIFVGFIMGVYSSIMANFFIKEEALAAIDQTMAMMQDMLPAEMFDQQYEMMKKMVVNPFYLVFISVLGQCFIGIFIALLISVSTKREPNIFANSEEQTSIDENDAEK